MEKQSVSGQLVLTFDSTGTLVQPVQMSYTLNDDVNTELTARKSLDPADHPTGQTTAVQAILTAFFNAMKTKEGIT